MTDVNFDALRRAFIYVQIEVKLLKELEEPGAL